jgi:hypothetical protein
MGELIEIEVIHVENSFTLQSCGRKHACASMRVLHAPARSDIHKAAQYVQRGVINLAYCVQCACDAVRGVERGVDAALGTAKDGMRERTGSF